MNSFLASIVGFLNGVLAIFFIIVGAGVGHNFYGQDGLIVGLLVGLLVAILVCGVLAVFISMRSELIEIRRLLESRQNQII
jgi:D-alanine-D-alanine ligase-like ATP-grasp enzyme